MTIKQRKQLLSAYLVIQELLKEDQPETAVTTEDYSTFFWYLQVMEKKIAEQLGIKIPLRVDVQTQIIASGRQLLCVLAQKSGITLKAVAVYLSRSYDVTRSISSDGNKKLESDEWFKEQFNAIQKKVDI